MLRGVDDPAPARANRRCLCEARPNIRLRPHQVGNVSPYLGMSEHGRDDSPFELRLERKEPHRRTFEGTKESIHARDNESPLVDVKVTEFSSFFDQKRGRAQNGQRR